MYCINEEQENVYYKIADKQTCGAIVIRAISDYEEPLLCIRI